MRAVGVRAGNRCVIRIDPANYIIFNTYYPERFLGRRGIKVIGTTAKNPVLFLDFAYRFIYSGQKWVKVEDVSDIPSGK